MMKNFLIAVLFFNLLVSTVAVAQVQLGVKAGPILASAATESSSSVFSSSAKLSYLAGGFLALPFHKRMSLQVELLYVNKGSGSVTNEVRSNLHYLNIPVLLQYRVIDKLNIELGPEVGYLLSAYNKYSNQSNLDNRTYMIEKFDVGIDAGVSYDLSEKLMLGLRYNIGINDFTKEFDVYVDQKPIGHELKAQNRTLQFSIGYKLF